MHKDVEEKECSSHSFYLKIMKMTQVFAFGIRKIHDTTRIVYFAMNAPVDSGSELIYFKVKNYKIYLEKEEQSWRLNTS